MTDICNADMLRIESGRSETAAPVPTGMHCRGSMTIISARSKKKTCDVLQHITWRRQLPESLGMLWRLLAVGFVAFARRILGETLAFVTRMVGSIRTRLIQRLGFRAGLDQRPASLRAGASRIVLPMICGSRPYFPAAP